MREKQIAASVFGRVSRSRGPSPFEISATPRPGRKPEEIEVLIYEEISKIQTEPVAASELAKARASAVSLESVGGVLNQRMQAREFGLPEDYWDTYAEKVMAVTAADVQRVARKYVPLDNVQLIAVGDAGKIAGVLSSFGPVEKYDAEGRKVQ